jgi:cytochrome P450
MLPSVECESFPPGPTDTCEKQLTCFNDHPYSYLKSLNDEYGSIFSLRLGSLGNESGIDVESNGRWVFLTRPQQIKIMYNADNDTVSGALANRVLFGTSEKSVTYIDGKAHRRRRSQLQPLFSGIRNYVSIVEKVTRKCMASWPRDEPFNLFAELQKLTVEVIVEIVCGNFKEAEFAQLCLMVQKAESDKSCKMDMVIRGYIHDHIDGYLERSKKCGRDDVFTALLKYGAEGDASLSGEVACDEVFGLMYTGFSTTASTLAWAFLRILSQPEVYQKLVQELEEKFQHEPLRWESLHQLSYLDAIIKEVLRLHPVTPLNGIRMVTKPIEIDGYIIPTGTVLVHCAYLLQRTADLYQDPEKFLPERFLNKTIDPYLWGSFGGGSRTCIARVFALEEMKLVLAITLATLRVKLTVGISGAQQQGFFMTPEDGLFCVIS